MRRRKAISTGCLTAIFWLLLAWAEAWRHKARTRADYADAGLVAALLLLGLGLLLLKVAARAGTGHEAARDARRFALIVMATAVTCGLVALGFRL